MKLKLIIGIALLFGALSSFAQQQKGSNSDKYGQSFDSKYFLLKEMSIPTDNGIVGFPIGTVLNKIRPGIDGNNVYIAKGQRIIVHDSIITTDPLVIHRYEKALKEWRERKRNYEKTLRKGK